MRAAPLVLALASTLTVAQEEQSCNDEDARLPQLPLAPVDLTVASVLADVRSLAAAAACTPLQGAAVVAYLGGDDDLGACKMQGLWGKVLRLAGAHAAAFSVGRTLVLASPDPWVGGCDDDAGAGGGWGCYFEPVSRCTLADLGISGEAAASPEKVWDESGWKPWQRDNAAEQPWLWSACGNQMNKYAAKKPGQQAPAPFDHHSNDFWPMAPKPPLSNAHRSVSASAWQAAFLRDITIRPTALTRRYIDNAVAGLGWQSPWSSGFALEGVGTQAIRCCL